MTTGMPDNLENTIEEREIADEPPLMKYSTLPGLLFILL
jgi:hypothetical protein